MKNSKFLARLMRHTAAVLAATLIMSECFSFQASAASINDEILASIGYKEGTPHSVSISYPDNGTIEILNSVTKATKGNGVEFALKPDYGYSVKSYWVEDTAGNRLDVRKFLDTDHYIFFMGDAPATVHAEFVRSEMFGISLKSDGNASVSFVAGNDGTYGVGNEASVKVTPNTGYVVNEVTWETEDGSMSGKAVQTDVDTYSFTMPDGNVSMYATTKQAEIHSIAIKNNNTTSNTIFALNTEEAVKGTKVFLSRSMNVTGYDYNVGAITKNGLSVGLTAQPDGSWYFLMPDDDVDIFISEMEMGGYEPQNEEYSAEFTKVEDLLIEENSDIPTEMDRATLMSMVVAASTKTVSHLQTSNYNGSKMEPSVTITKDARWTDIEQGYAQITLTEKDTSVYSETPVDFIVCVDRSDSTLVDLHYTHWYTSAGLWLAGQSPCQNDTHSYRLYDGNYYFLMTWDYGVREGGTSLTYISYAPYPGGMSEYQTYNYHYNNITNNHIGTVHGQDSNFRDIYSYGYHTGCYGRREVEIDAAKSIITAIRSFETQNNANGTLPVSRVAFWAFGGDNDSHDAGIPGIPGAVLKPEEVASGPHMVNGVDFSDRGLSAYMGWTPITTGETALKNKTDTVGHGGGTSYSGSFDLAYQLIRSREGTEYEHVPVRFVMLTDGLPGDGRTQLTAKANLLKSYNKAPVTLAIVGVGLPDASWMDMDLPYIRSLTTQNLRIVKRDGTSYVRAHSYFPTNQFTSSDVMDAVTTIASATTEISAKDKVYTDYVSEYFDIVSVSTANGSISYTGNKVTWNVTAGQGNTYTATITVKLKDTYRYLVSDTEYPTNTSAGLDFNIYFGAYNDFHEPQSITIDTPILPYGTVRMTGEKYWGVDNSRIDSVTIQAERAVSGNDVFTVVGSAETVDDTFIIDRKINTTDIPLVLYTNDEERYVYRTTEVNPDYYYDDKHETTTDDDLNYESKHLNMPVGADADGGVNLIKLDYDTGKTIKDAEFTVFAYAGSGEVSDLANYEVYCYTPYDDPGDYDARGIVNTVSYNSYMADPAAYDAVKLLYDEEQDRYVNTAPLYYTPVNGGYFKIVETKTPAGYYGDWKDDITPDASSTYLDRKSYDVVLNPKDAHQEFTIYNREDDHTFRNLSIRGEIILDKTGELATGYTEDEDGNKTVTYETRGLRGAWYIVRAAEDIRDPQGDIVYEKGDIVSPMEEKQTHYVSLSDLDLSIYGNEEDSTHIVHVGETVEDNILVEDPDGTSIKGTIVTKTEYMGSGYETLDLYDDFVLDKDAAILIFADGKSTDKVFITDEDGIAKIEYLDQGAYEVIEVKAPTGYVRGRGFVVEVDAAGVSHKRPTNSAYVHFEETSDWVHIVTKEISYYNERQRPATPGIPEEPPVEKDNNPSIAITKSADKEFYFPGEIVTYTVTVTNDGDVDLFDVVVTDILDNLPSTERVVATFDSLKVGESKTFTYMYAIPETDEDGTIHVNVATVVGRSEPDPEFGIPEKSVTDKDDAKIKVKTGLGILKTADKKLYMNGETITYTVYVTNHSTVSANTFDDMEGYKKEVVEKTLTDLVVTDVIQTAGIEDLKYVSTDMPDRVSVRDDGKVYISYLAPGEVCILMYTARISDDFEGDLVDNTASVTSSDGQKDDDDERVYVKNPSIKVTKVADKHDFSAAELTDSVSGNNIVNYTITVINDGDCDLDNVRLHDTVLIDGYFNDDLRVSISGNSVEQTEDNAYLFECSVSGNYANVGYLPVNGVKTITYTYVLKPEDAGKKIPNIVLAEGDTIPENPDEPPKTVTDKDDEKINAGVAVGLQKLSDKGGTEAPTPGAVFALYAAEDITNLEGTIIFPKGTLIETAVTDEYGYANFHTAQLPLGEYIVKEIQAPDGCYPSDAIVYLHLSNYMYDDSVAIVHAGGIFRNNAVRLLVYLYDDNTMNELADAEFEVYSVSDNTIVDTWVTKNTNGDGYMVYGCTPGVEYVLREKVAREGYVNKVVRDLSDSSLSTNSISGTEISFRIPEELPRTSTDEDDPMYGKIDPQTEPKTYRLRVTNDFVEGTLRIYKTGEYLDSWNFFDKAAHWIYSIFSFFTGPLSDIEFTITANEDIYHPDGVTGLLFEKGDVVYRGVKSIRSDAVELTDETGMAVFEQLYLGEYTVSETRGKEGLAAMKPVNFSLAYVDQNTPIVYATEEGMTVNNVHQVIQLNITKVDRDTLEVLPGAEFELYAAEDIVNRDGAVITKKDTLLESGIFTDENGEAHIESVLSVGPTYYLKEVTAPAGYKIDEENLRIEFSTAPENFTDEFMIFNFTVKDTRNDDGLTVEKSAPETAIVGESIRYSIDVVRNDSRVPVDQFTLHDTLPDNVNMTSLYTGTYNASVSMNALYKTNLSSDWKIWRENMNSSTGVELTTASLNLKENEYVTEFAIDYGTVPAGFSAKEGDTPYYYVTIGKADVGTNFVNHIELTGYVNGEKLESSDSTVTKITNARKTPQTGDDNRWFGFFLAMLIIALIALGTYIAVMRSKKKQIHAADDEEEPRKRLFPKKVPNVPLSELVKKK